METISIVFKFHKCQDTDIEEELVELGYEIKLLPNLSDVNKSQQSFCDKYEIPCMELIPTVTTYKETQNVHSNAKVWNVRDRFLVSKYGLVYWEISFQTHIESLPRHFNNIMTIEGRNLLSNAIYRKSLLCTGTSDPKSRCESCDLTKTYEEIRLVTTSKATIFDQINSRKGKISKYTSYSIRDVQWTIRKLWQVVLYDKTKPSDLTKIRNSIIISTIIPTSMKYNGDEILQQIMHSVPPFKMPNDLEDQIRTYLQYFFFRFFFTSPQFLLSKQSTRLHLPPLLLKCFNYAFDCFGDPDLWEVDKKKLLQIPKSLIIINRLFLILFKIPHAFTLKWAQLLNPFNAAIPVASIGLHKQLSVDHIKIIMTMAKSLIDNSTTNIAAPLHSQTSLEPFTKSQLTEELGYPRGRKTEMVEENLIELVKLNILIKTTPKELGVKRGRASELFYLNPELAYTQFILQIIQHFPKHDFSSLIEFLEK